MDQNPNGPGGADAPRYRDVQTWRRSRSDRMVAGVCGGVGRALNIDPVLIRVLVAVLTVAGGAGIPIYIAAWLLMPEEGSDKAAAEDMFGRRVRPNHPWLWPVVIGVGICIAVGLSSSVHIWPFSFPGPLIAILFIWFLVNRRKHNRTRGGESSMHGWSGGDGGAGDQHWSGPAAPGPYQPTTAAAPQAGSPYPAGPASSATQRPQDRPQGRVQDSVTSAAGPGPVWTEDDPLGLYVDDEPAPVSVTSTPDAPVCRRRWVKPAVASLTALAIGIALLSGAVLPLALAIGLVTLGAGMVVGAFLGRTRGLVPIGLLLAIGVALTQTFDSVPEFSDKQLAPTSVFAATTPTTYEMGVGQMRLDLTRAQIQNNAQVIVTGQVGEVTVVLPPNVDVAGTANIKSAGEVNAFGERRDGTKITMPYSDLGQDLKKGPLTLKLDVTMKFGSIIVERG